MGRYIVILVMAFCSASICWSSPFSLNKLIPNRHSGDTITDTENRIDKQILDSLKRDKDYWKKALMKGQLDLKDETIVYPKFIKFCVDTYNWADKTFNSYDSAYVVGTGKRWKLMARTDNWIDNYSLHFPKSTPIRTLSNISCNIGGYISYMAVSLGYMFDADHLFGHEPITHTKWDFSFSCALFSLDLYYTQNSGSTVIRRFGDYNGGKTIRYPFSELYSEAYGIDMYYFFNNKKYSQGAAYNYSKFQKRSAGSFIAGITASSQDVSMDFSNLSDEMISSLPDPTNLYYRFRYYDYCFLLGYGYNWVLGKHWLLNISALPSVGFKHCLKESEEGLNDIFSANIKGKFGVVYNHRQLFVGLVGKVDLHWYSSRRYNFFNSIEYLNLCTGVRF